MRDRDRLIELLQEYTDNNNGGGSNHGRADYLLANGVIVQPCKMGDKVYVISRYYAGDWEIYECNIESITVYEKNTFISCVANDVRFGRINFGLNISDLNKTFFLTKEEAEKALAERKDNNG